MSNKNSGSGCVVGFLLILVYGLLIICNVPFSFIWLWPVIFCFITLISSIDYSSWRANHYKSVKKNIDQDQHKQRPGVNHYIMKSSVKNDVQTLVVKDYKPIDPIKPKALFCQVCGTRRDKDATFCHQCGSKLE
ncbi:MAG: zinc-ribbon domain-containing protein [Promethearchaeota archaeon]